MLSRSYPIPGWNADTVGTSMVVIPWAVGETQAEEFLLHCREWSWGMGQLQHRGRLGREDGILKCELEESEPS
jgi:hypothetical protein